MYDCIMLIVSWFTYCAYIHTIIIELCINILHSIFSLTSVFNVTIKWYIIQRYFNRLLIYPKNFLLILQRERKKEILYKINVLPSDCYYVNIKKNYISKKIMRRLDIKLNILIKFINSDSYQRKNVRTYYFLQY